MDRLLNRLASPEALELAALFRTRFGVAPAFVVRAPGRVNLIGEHIDYAHFGVLPFAIEQCVLIAVSQSTDASFATVENTDQHSHKGSKLPLGLAALQQHHISSGWLTYVRAGILAAHELAATHLVPADTTHVGLNLLVLGTVPQGSGLSSSSALVVASALAALHATWPQSHRDTVTPELFATACAHAERYVGTAGGGMDQAISVNAVAGAASLVEFVPRLALQPVALPSSARFVVANSCVVSAKAETAAERFNLRVAETRLAAAVLGGHDTSVIVLRDVADRNPELSLRNLAAMADKALHKEPYSLAEVATACGQSEEVVRARCITRPVSGNAFQLHDRALHVFSEAARVHEFAVTCRNGSSSIVSLGSLMNQSHSSCRELYQCSCAELDEVVRIALEAGAAGARLTGAGWGGCAVALCDGDIVAQAVVDALDRLYYTAQCSLKPGEAQLKGYLFQTTPAAGASITVFC